MRIIYTFIFFVLSITCLYGQERILSGVVSDSSTGEKLVGATVVAGTVGTITDTKGFFQITLNPSQTWIEVSYIGYETKRIEVNGLQQVLVLLTEQSRFLNPIVVSTTRSNQKEERATVSVTSIQPYLIQNRITTNIENTVRLIPGVSTTDGQANIRSGSGWSYGTGSRVSILVDDMPMLTAGTGQALWSYMPIENVRQIEVIKSSSSVLYGSSALNGVIHIRTDWPGNRELVSASVFSGVYSFPEEKNWRWQGNKPLLKSGAHLLYGNGGERYQYVVSANGLFDDGYRMGEPDKRIRLSGKSKFFSKNKRLSLGLNANYFKGESGAFLLWESYDLAYTSNDSAYGLTRSTRYNIDPILEFKGKYFDYVLQNRFYEVDNRIEQNGSDPDQSNATRSVYNEFRMVLKAFQDKGLLVNVGGVNQYGETRANIFQGFKIQQNHALFLQADYQNKRLSLSGGIRWEKYRLEEYSEARPVVKFGANYQLGKATFLRASFGQGYRFPVVSERFVQTRTGPVVIYPNPTLKAESGYSTELGIRQGVKLKNGIQFMADLAVYRMYFENMMEFTFGQWGGLNEPLAGIGFKSLNIGPALIQGAEITLTGGREWSKNKVMVIAGYNYADPVNLDPEFSFVDVHGNTSTYKQFSTNSSGRVLKYRHRHLVKTDIQFETTRYGLGMSYQYASQFEAIDASFVFLSAINFPGVEQSMADNKRGNHLFDIRGFYRISSTLKAQLAINNIFNQMVLLRPCDIGPPRHISLQLNYSIN